MGKKRAIEKSSMADDEPSQKRIKVSTPPTFKNFLTACKFFKFPGSHQVGSFGPSKQGIVRTYSNSTAGKDMFQNNGDLFLYRLKDERVRAQFIINQTTRKPVHLFTKILTKPTHVVDHGLFWIDGFVPVGNNNQPMKFGKEFVRFVKRREQPTEQCGANDDATVSTRKLKTESNGVV
jgi:hypothetical protein